MKQRVVAPRQRWHRIRQGFALCIIAFAVLIVWTTPLGEQLRLLLRDPSPERLQLWLSANTTGVAFVIVVLMILHTLVPVPAEILALVAGMMLGPFWGFVSIWIGAVLGAYLGFFLARAFGQGLMQRLAAQQRLQRLQGWMQRTDVPLLLAVRLFPVFSFNLVNYALGLTPISWWRFTWTTGIGIVPVTAITVVFGAHLHDWRVLLLLILTAVLVCLGGYLVLRYRSTAFPT